MLCMPPPRSDLRRWGTNPAPPWAIVGMKRPPEGGLCVSSGQG